MWELRLLVKNSVGSVSNHYTLLNIYTSRDDFVSCCHNKQKVVRMIYNQKYVTSYLFIAQNILVY